MVNGGEKTGFFGKNPVFMPGEIVFRGLMMVKPRMTRNEKIPEG